MKRKFHNFFNKLEDKWRRLPLYVKLTVDMFFIFAGGILILSCVSYVVFKNVISKGIQEVVTDTIIGMGNLLFRPIAPDDNDVHGLVADKVAPQLDLFVRQYLIIAGLGLVIVGGIVVYLSTSRTIRQVDIEHQKQVDFIQNASHDLKTPLTVISGYAQLLYSKRKDPEVAKILENSTRMRTLIDDMLLLAKTDSSSTEMHIEANVDVANVLRTAATEFGELNAKRMVKFSSTPKAILISTDLMLIKRIFDNVFSNIQKYTADNTNVDVEISQVKNKVNIIIADYGPGISQEKLSRIFDRFVTADDSRNTKGNGLGLAIVKELATALGGSAKAYATDKDKNLGLTIDITLPIKPSKSS